MDRRGSSDPYYTVFGAECLRALGQAAPRAVGEYVRRFGSGSGLDLVHLACLVRLRTSGGGVDADLRTELVGRIESFRTPKGGFALTPQAPGPSVYADFMAVAALQDLGVGPADPDGLLAGVHACRTADGGYAGHGGIPLATTPTTAAAAVLLAELGRTVGPETVDWLLARRHGSGGFLAAAGAPDPDLLSTAVALYALTVAAADLGGVARPARDFVDRLYCGGFRGHLTEDRPDCEYTFYGLLALGHLID
jgi:hypothetical protein